MTESSYTVTTVGDAPAVERAQRVRKYAVMMSVRMACIVVMPFVDGLWVLACALGAVFLPYVAVVAANVKARSSSESELEGVQQQLEGSPEPAASQSPDGPLVFTVDESLIKVTKVERYDG